MKNCKSKLNQEVTPKMLIAIYHGNSHSEDFYLETHALSEKGEVLEGKPLNHETVDVILNNFRATKNETIKPKGVVPKNLLYIDDEKSYYVWTNEPQKRNLLFGGNLKIDDGEAMLPKLVFVANKNELSVYAMKKDDQLYRAPFHNVFSSNVVCQGSASSSKSRSSYQGILEYWEQIFFSSRFTHVNGENPTVKDVSEIWKEAIASGGKKKFDVEQLIKIGNKKLKDLFK